MTWAGDWEGDADGLILAVLVDLIVHAQFVVRKRRFTSPAVGKNLEAFVDQSFFIKLLERPEHALGVVGVQSLVVVVEIDPPGLASYIGAPVFGVLKNRGLAKLIELSNAKLFNFRSARDPQEALGLNLSGKSVGVPTKATLYTVATHGLVSRD